MENHEAFFLINSKIKNDDNNLEENKIMNQMYETSINSNNKEFSFSFHQSENVSLFNENNLVHNFKNNNINYSYQTNPNLFNKYKKLISNEIDKNNIWSDKNIISVYPDKIKEYLKNGDLNAERLSPKTSRMTVKNEKIICNETLEFNNIYNGNNKIKLNQKTNLNPRVESDKILNENQKTKLKKKIFGKKNKVDYFNNEPYKKCENNKIMSRVVLEDDLTDKW